MTPMSHLTGTQHDGSVTQGRKGVPYDWQSLVPEFRITDEALAALTGHGEPAPMATSHR